MLVPWEQVGKLDCAQQWGHAHCRVLMCSTVPVHGTARLAYVSFLSRYHGFHTFVSLESFCDNEHFAAKNNKPYSRWNRIVLHIVNSGDKGWHQQPKSFPYFCSTNLSADFTSIAKWLLQNQSSSWTWKRLGMEGREYNLVSFILGTGSA